MVEVINLDNQTKPEVSIGAYEDSMVVCVKTSAPDIYVSAIEFKGTTPLREGDRVPFQRMDRMRLHIFRMAVGDAPYSATLEVRPVPPAPHAANLLASFPLNVPPLAPQPARKRQRKPKAK